MSLDARRLRELRAKLLEARLSGLRRFRDSNGENITYGTDAEMAGALASIDAELARIGEGPARPPLTLHFRSSKGV